MPHVIIKYKTPNPPITIYYKELTDIELTAKRRDMFNSQFGSRFRDFENHHSRPQNWFFTHSGRSIQVEAWAHDDFEYVAEVKRNIQIVIERFLQHNMLGFLQTFFEKHITLYLDAHKQGGAGYVVCDQFRTDPQIRIFLPNTMVSQSNILAHKFATQASRGESSWDRVIRGYIVHEFGHVFHQLVTPSYYYGLSETVSCRGGMVPKYAPFFIRAPSNNQFNRAMYAHNLGVYTAELSSYGTTVPLDFVAETFSGLLMGVTFSNALIDQYKCFGGPDIVHRAGLLAHKG